MSDIDNAILAELKKMNEFLGKMDWKLWNIHEKYMNYEQEEKVVVKEIIKEVVREESVPSATVAAAAEVPKFVPKVVTQVAASNLEEPPVSVIPDIPKYPTIEKA